MRQPLTNLVDFFGALWVLLTLGVHSRFNLRSSYWNWRLHTAFPKANIPGGQTGKWRFAIEYARWAYRIRRLR